MGGPGCAGRKAARVARTDGVGGGMPPVQEWKPVGMRMNDPGSTLAPLCVRAV